MPHVDRLERFWHQAPEPVTANDCATILLIEANQKLDQMNMERNALRADLAAAEMDKSWWRAACVGAWLGNLIAVGMVAWAKS